MYGLRALRTTFDSQSNASKLIKQRKHVIIEAVSVRLSGKVLPNAKLKTFPGIKEWYGNEEKKTGIFTFV